MMRKTKEAWMIMREERMRGAAQCYWTSVRFSPCRSRGAVGRCWTLCGVLSRGPRLEGEKVAAEANAGVRLAW
jgi:hypothetical protein